ncbi:hypothetical protein [Terasakiella sp. SH-1]|uniref:hypothetical protein n=1 Tax=Terasakiella sp. SH-1 TaxID=2560057 RepID=UPI00107412D3|nr:hypothetical protein [Terasakiella sp. SH-1]
MINLRAPFYGLAGAGRLVRLDISGAKMMVGGIQGFWASLYWAATLVAPFYVLLALLRFNPEKHDGARYFILEAEIYALAWLIFPILMERVCHSINRRGEFLEFIIAYNWLGCLYNIMYLLVALAQASKMISWEAASSLSVGLMFAGLVWIGHLAHKSLRIPISAAVGIVILDLFLGIMMSMLNAALLAR